MRQILITFIQSSQDLTVHSLFTCFVQAVNLKSFCKFFKSNKKQYYIRNMYKARKSTKNLFSNFGLIEKTMDPS